MTGPPTASPGEAADLSLAEGACLCLVVAGHEHGWALVRELAPTGEIGRIWSLSRPLTYRAIDRLVARGLLERGESVPGATGTARTLLTATPVGRRAARRWVRTPVAHLRDVRTELLVKLAMAERLRIDRVQLVDEDHEASATTCADLRAGLVQQVLHRRDLRPARRRVRPGSIG